MYGAQTLLNPNTLNVSSSFPIPSSSSTFPFYASLIPFQSQNFAINKAFPKRAFTISSPHYSLQSSPQHGTIEDDDEPIIGDCVVFEEGIFDDPFIQKQNFKPKENPRRNTKRSPEVLTENLIPDKWVEVQREINITKKERRLLAQQLEHGRKSEIRRMESRPIEAGKAVRKVNAEDYLKYRNEKLRKLKPLVLDNPRFGEDEVEEKGVDSTTRESIELRWGVTESSRRVAPRNPRLAVYGKGLEDISEFFVSGNYDPDAAKKSEGRRKLFSNEEKLLLGRRIPDITAATSDKWVPLHTLAASGEFYLMTSLLKHVVDINLPDKDGLTAIHKAILGNKQAIFNCLLRESANPFVRDKDGWTPLHLAVQSRRPDIVRLLLIKGADKTLVNKDGLTPLDICLYSGRDSRTYELIKLLKQLPKSRRQ